MSAGSHYRKSQSHEARFLNRAHAKRIISHWVEARESFTASGSQTISQFTESASTLRQGLHRNTWAEIHLDALAHNVTTLRTKLHPDVKMMGVVKADAYGHGALPCSQTVLEAGADSLGVGILSEGIELREGGIAAPIHVLVGVFPDEVQDLLQHNLSTTLYSRTIADALSQEAARKNQVAEVHIKVDTGMGRLGVAMDDLPDFIEYVTGLKNLTIGSLFTHLSCADEEAEYTQLQLKRLNDVRSRLTDKGLTCPPLHCANSAAMLHFPESHHNLVRPGIALYGARPPAPSTLPESSVDLRPVMHWKTRILQVRSIEQGSGLSYGKRFTTQRDSRIAVLPVGYADGLHRGLSGHMEVLVKGQRIKQVGTICMDMTLADITDLPDVMEGEEVVLFGSQGEASIAVEEMADRAGTIPYEILCGVGKRVPRRYLP